jgi:phosphoribosylformimino-5-aminoimidazole carboxamide ribotide isomerase
VANPELVDEAAKVVDVAVGLDHRNGRVAVHGWTRDAGMTLVTALDKFPAASAFIITDIARDGMLQGPDIDGLTHAAHATSIPVIASGGVSTLADIEVLARIPGVTGIIMGKAIYEGRFSVREALECVETKRDGS